MLVMNNDGELFDERRKAERRNLKRRDNDVIAEGAEKQNDRRKGERRKNNINAKK